ncbi:hypothetical protein BKA81DRAFT_383454 [Phyllosticta paracitricarpa]
MPTIIEVGYILYLKKKIEKKKVEKVEKYKDRKSKKLAIPIDILLPRLLSQHGPILFSILKRPRDSYILSLKKKVEKRPRDSYVLYLKKKIEKLKAYINLYISLF